MMSNIQKVEGVLKMKTTPSTKIGLIALILSDDPMTTKELNGVLDCKKTFQNYEDMFEEEIQSGLIKIVPQRTSDGQLRRHFLIDEKKLEEIIEEDE